ncbi:thioester reductase domain-containing protein [Paraglaciecola sp. 20A4]|uniref:thioester reductase domain-containing protein n=1 Tax=Paraglaciecola sp. 20A4 TaxID=2687288 RepID=UPI001407BD4F|nr:thioester reductase domain-containing protein [Paraglaciecola sp. 20A4]
MGNNKALSDIKLRIAERFKKIVKADPSILAYMPNEAIKKEALASELSLTKKIDLLFSQYGERTALAERTYDVVVDQATGLQHKQYRKAFSGISYTELLSRIHGLANVWCGVGDSLGEHRVKTGEFVCIIGFASIDFQVIDMACLYAQAVTVPLQSTTSGADLKEIFENMNPAAIAATVNDLKVAASHAIEHGNINSLIVFDYEDRDADDRAIFDEVLLLIEKSGLPIKLCVLDDLIKRGLNQPWHALPSCDEGDSRLAAIIHSSGSTGKPKGAMLTEKAIRYVWEIYLSAPIQIPNISVIYAPLNHLLGRGNVIGTLATGGTSNFALKPDMSTLFEDVRIVDPTRLTFFPRVFELIYQHYQNEVSKRIRKGEDENSASAAVKTGMGEYFLGRRLLSGIVGGAPTSPAVRAFMGECFDFVLLDGYGNTESGTGGIAVNGIIQSPPVTEYKLRDVPELGYYSTDKPFPRGELCYKSEVGVTGYYKQPEATAELFDEDGFSLTGDIVEERAPNHIVVVDRRKDVLKLSQGEYVALGTLAVDFESGSPVIKQLYLYGNPLQAYLLGVVVPDLEAVESVLGDGWTQTELMALLRSEMQKVAVAKELKSFEVPRDLIIENEAFSQENGLLSSVRKRLGPALKKKYGERLEEIYLKHESMKDAEIDSLKSESCMLSTREKVAKIVAFTLRLDDVDANSPQSFATLGGDSLAAVTLSLELEGIFGVEVPADVILSPMGNIARWAKRIDSAIEGLHDRPSFETIHGKNAEIVNAEDLQISRFLGDDFVNVAEMAQPVSSAEPKVVLLTGANGFLGRFVCLQWLKKLAPVGGKLICLIRAEDNISARQRLDAIFSGSIENDYQQLASEHLEVYSGDVAESNFGLEIDDYTRLVGDVDRVVHVAAMVNHVMGYANMFSANVVGTAEIIKFALTNTKKPIDFVSSVSVKYYLDLSKGDNEESPLLNSVPLITTYAAGYGLSKWAGEHLLSKAQAEYGLPVNVFRGDMMLAHEDYKGQINTDDMFTRLLLSIIATGLAPQSFYQRNSDGGIQSGHYNGVPVNIVADTIVGGYSLNRSSDNNIHQSGFSVINISNFHDYDGCSLDSFVNDIESAGYAITKIEDHGEWFKRFKQKLNALPENVKKMSVISLLEAFANPYPAAQPGTGCNNFKSLLEHYLEEKLPHLDQYFVNKCIEDIKSMGMLNDVVN